MKYSVLVFAFLIGLSPVYAQKDKGMGSDNMYNKKKWKVGKTRMAYGLEVVKLEGEVSVYSMTNIGFESYEYRLETINKTAKKEMWTEAKLEKELKFYEHYKGGLIHLRIGRSSIGAGNTEYFTIIVKDLDENEISRRTLGSDIPSVPTGAGGADVRLWRNYGGEYLEEKIPANFYVYVVDALSDAPPYKFLVKQYPDPE
tara:strand:- start:1797 stop:2396 length:600 start_codon:yes stop_codon:yes gene_type:complete